MRAMRIGIGLIIGISIEASLSSEEWQIWLQQPVEECNVQERKVSVFSQRNHYASPTSLQLLWGTLPLFSLSPELLHIEAWEQRISQEPMSADEMQVWDTVAISWRVLGAIQQDIHTSLKCLSAIYNSYNMAQYVLQWYELEEMFWCRAPLCQQADELLKLLQDTTAEAQGIRRAMLGCSSCSFCTLYKVNRVLVDALLQCNKELYLWKAAAVFPMCIPYYQSIVQAKIMYLRLTCGEKIPFPQIEQTAAKLIKAIGYLQLIRKDIYQPAKGMAL